MKNRKPSLTVNLYKEGLLQLRFMGLLSGILIVLVSVGQALSLVFAVGTGQLTGLEPLAYVLDPEGLISLALVAVFVLPFLFVFRLFSFLNKRNRSDFYHALPASRSTLFFSFTAAVLTWLWGIGIVSIGLTALVSLLGGVALSFATIASALGLFLTASLFAVAAALVAASVTGTLFSNLIVTALIILLPHLITRCFTQMVSAQVPNLPEAFVGIIGNISVQNSFFMLWPFGNASLQQFFGAGSTAASIFVTLAWAAILLLCARVLFRRRASETAGKSAPSKRLALLYRVAVGILVVAFCVGPTWMSLSGIDYDMSGGVSVADLPVPGSAAILTALGTVLILALIAFLVFELITTKRWSRLLRALPSFAIVIAFAVAFYGVTALYINFEKNFRPSAKAISSVRLLSTQYDPSLFLGDLTNSFFLQQENQPSSYNELLLQQLKISDPGFLDATSDKLQQRFRASDIYATDETHSVMLLEVRTKTGRTAYRLIRTRLGKQADSFAQAMFTTPDVSRALLSLPEPGKHTQVISDAYMYIGDIPGVPSAISAAEQKRLNRELYEQFKADYENLSPDEQYQTLYGWQYGYTPTPSAETTTIADLIIGSTLEVDGVFGTRTYHGIYNFTSPQTVEQFWEMTHSELTACLESGRKDFHIDELDLYTPRALRLMSDLSVEETSAAMPEDGTNYFWAVASKRYAQTFGSDWDENNEGDYEDEDGTYVETQTISNAAMDKALEAIRPALARKFDAGAPFYVMVTYGIYNKTGKEEIGQNTLLIPLTAKEAATLQKLTPTK